MKPWEVKQLYATLISLGEYPLCNLCGKPIYSIDDFSWDHIIPKANDGPDTLDNFQPAHCDCNGCRGKKKLMRKESDHTQLITEVKIHYKDVRNNSYDITITTYTNGNSNIEKYTKIHKKIKDKYKKRNVQRNRGGR